MMADLEDRTPARVVVVGGGVAAAEAVLALADLAGDRAQLTILAPDDHLRLTPLGVAAAFGLDYHRIPLTELAGATGADLHATEMVRVNADSSTISCSDGTVEPYDVLVLAVGAHHREWLEGAVTLGTPGEREGMAEVVDALGRDIVPSMAFLAPAEATWTLPLYERALMVADHVRGAPNVPAMSLVTAERMPVELFGPRVSAAVHGMLDDAGIHFRSAEDPASHGVRFASRVVCLPAVDGPRLPGVPGDAEGFVPVDGYGRVRGLSRVYAVGDVTDSPVKQGAIACLHADLVAAHIAGRLGADVEVEPLSGAYHGRLLVSRRRGVLGLEAGQPPGDTRLWEPAAKLGNLRLSAWVAARQHVAG